MRTAHQFFEFTQAKHTKNFRYVFLSVCLHAIWLLSFSSGNAKMMMIEALIVVSSILKRQFSEYTEYIVGNRMKILPLQTRLNAKVNRFHLNSHTAHFPPSPLNIL